jgi:uncharacterized membrane protein YphA (DoxX/SURF4 family)
MFRRLISTTDDFALTILRLVLGIVFFAHGSQKMLGWFGGYGFKGTMGFSRSSYTFRLLSPRWQSSLNSSAAWV